MKILLTVAAASLLALSAPAFAQNAGAPAASGVTGPLTGSNPGTGFGWNGPIGDRINPGPGPSEAYPNSPGNAQRGYLDEGRASAPDYGPGYNGGNYGGGYGDNQGWNQGQGYQQGYNQGWNQGNNGGYGNQQ